MPANDHWSQLTDAQIAQVLVTAISCGRAILAAIDQPNFDRTRHQHIAGGTSATPDRNRWDHLEYSRTQRHALLKAKFTTDPAEALRVPLTLYRDAARAAARTRPDLVESLRADPMPPPFDPGYQEWHWLRRTPITEVLTVGLADVRPFDQLTLL